jgi:hypothetical protein
MKKFISVSLVAFGSFASAQWSNTTNQFYDSLHMPVSIALQTQKNPIVLISYPDEGYFVIWEDDRNYATTKTDIYAQKYDQSGNRLWAADGVAVSNGANIQHYVSNTNDDYRNHPYAATDSAGGFYLCFLDDSIGTYSSERVAVQHVLSDGSRRFSPIGYIISQTPSGQSYTHSAPFLIPDANKGFYISFSRNQFENQIFVYCYKDVNGTMQFFGGGRVNENAVQRSAIGPCGIRTYLEYAGTTIAGYNIWPDRQGGCNVIMALSGNGLQGRMLAFNRVWRAKKTSRVRTYFRNTAGLTCPRITEYKKDSVYLLYNLKFNVIETRCGGGGGPLYVVTSERLTSNGYQVLDGAYDFYYPKGTTLSTTGNINVDFIAAERRTYENNVVSDFTVKGYAYAVEKYDSVPYQHMSFMNPDVAYNVEPPISVLLDTLRNFKDTILAPGRYYYDFSLAGGGSSILASALIWENDGSSANERKVRLQHLGVNRKSTNSFAVEFSTKPGVLIGREIGTGIGSNNISYDFPVVAVNSLGAAFFYIREYNRSARISPIFDRSELAWGAMGRTVGTGVYNNSYYNFEQPFAILRSIGGTGIIAWSDNRNIPGNTGENIWMRHIDSFLNFFYKPPVMPVKSVYSPYGATTANSIVLFGSSKRYSVIEAYTDGYYSLNPGTSTVAEILDNNNLGKVIVNVFQNRGAIRRYNNQPYLDRNFTINAENNPAGVNINLRLYFTKEEFDALKANDNSLTDPGDLVVIKQPNNTTITPSVYTPIAGEEVLSPIKWEILPGGYYLEVIVNGFSNFFIQKTGIAAICPGGNTSIESSITGSSYQWQVNTGSGFINITDNSNYSGSNSVRLQLNNIPSSWAGYKYRCVVNGLNSNVITLRFTNTWTGMANNNWETAANWSCSSVPDEHTDVVINGGTVIVNSNATCRSLTINTGVTLTVNPGYILTQTY